MATSLERRVRVLEDAGGGDECPRCSGMVVVLMGGEFSSASKHGKEMSEKEYLAHEAQDGPDGECPVCGERPISMIVGWPEDLIPE